MNSWCLILLERLTNVFTGDIMRSNRRMVRGLIPVELGRREQRDVGHRAAAEDGGFHRTERGGHGGRVKPEVLGQRGDGEAGSHPAQQGWARRAWTRRCGAAPSAEVSGVARVA